jgi:predicted RNA-binding protein with PIN domain
VPGDELLDPVLTRALGIARARAADGAEVPGALRPLLRFRRLTGPARTAVRSALDASEELRDSVAAAVSERDVGRAGWLLVARPEGWEDELAELQDRARRRAEAAEEDRAAQRHAKRAERAEGRAERAEARARDLEAGLAERDAELDAARARADELHAELARHRADTEAARAQRQEAVHQLQAERARADERSREANRLRSELGELRELVDRLADRAPGPEDATAGIEPPDADARVSADPGRAADALRRAATAAAEVAAALADAAGAVADGPSSAAPDLPAASAAPPSGPPPARPPRRPPPLPPGVLDDSVEAAEALLRRPDAVVLVDGYNAAMAAWPDATKADQRRRLEERLDELAARWRCHPEIVWDGAEVPEPRPVLAPRGVRVRFSPAGVDADDVILQRLDELPVDVEVVVVSSDREVREGARRGGAALVSSDQLLGVLGGR